MAERKVYAVYARQNFTGPLELQSWFYDKRSANEAARRLKLFWDETKVLTMFEYEVRK